MLNRKRNVMADLCCGRGGWSRGFLAHNFMCYGFDSDARFRNVYPGAFVCADIREVRGGMLADLGVKIICASPPCEEFTRVSLPWTRKFNPPAPDAALALIRHCYRIADEAGAKLILENNRFAQRWLGPAILHCGPFYLWGDGVPALCYRRVPMRRKENFTSGARDRRAEIPFDLSDWVARQYVHD